jgi:hypothetical protein
MQNAVSHVIAGGLRFVAVWTLCHCMGFSDEQRAEVPAAEFTIRSETGDQSEVTGQILVQAQDGGVLLEERNGRIRQITPAMIVSRTESEQSFSRLTADELAADLLSQVPAGFQIVQTDHYVICSNSSDEYAEFAGKLLEKVFEEYFSFMKQQDIAVVVPAFKLPIIILQSQSDLQEFAARQHPETSFEDTPGYYSIRENQTLLLDLTQDRSIRSATAIRKRLAERPWQVATMVHEAVHQLAFNSGLQVRMADNPVWFSEGLALYFEPIVPRALSLWTRPGIVNGRHHPVFMRAAESGKPEITFVDLLQSDKPFVDEQRVAVAYAESWGLTMYLFRQQRDGMKMFATTLSQRKPLQKVSPEQRIQEFQTAFGKSPDQMEAEVVSFVRRLRVPK